MPMIERLDTQTEKFLYMLLRLAVRAACDPDRTPNHRLRAMNDAVKINEEIDHRHMQRNALGTYIECHGPRCVALDAGHEIQGA